MKFLRLHGRPSLVNYAYSFEEYNFINTKAVVRVSSFRMGYLLVVLAVVLVPIVAQTPTCRSAISQRIDDLNNAVFNLNARLLVLVPSR